MRRISKRPEPEALTRARSDGRGYGHLDKETLEAMRLQLCQEQGGLCCFCESSIDPAGAAMRIAHFVPRAVENARELDWDNLLAACHGNAPVQLKPAPTQGRQRVKASDLHCDARQRNRSLDERLHPCRIEGGTIRFQADGHIIGAGDVLHRDIEEKLNLNHPRLKRARLARFDELIAAASEFNQPPMALVRLVPDAAGRLDEYASFIAQMLLPAA
jgi:uncharacterized protein (TIGR02646 family)